MDISCSQSLSVFSISVMSTKIAHNDSWRPTEILYQSLDGRGQALTLWQTLSNALVVSFYLNAAKPFFRVWLCSQWNGLKVRALSIFGKRWRCALAHLLTWVTRGSNHWTHKDRTWFCIDFLNRTCVPSSDEMLKNTRR